MQMEKSKVTELIHSRPRWEPSLMLQALCTTNYSTLHPITKSQEILSEHPRCAISWKHRWEIRVGEISRFNWSSAHVRGREVGLCAEVYSWDLLSHHHPPKMHTHPSISPLSIMLSAVPRTFYSTFSCCSPSKGKAAHSSLFCEAVCAEWLSLTHFWPLRALQITLLQNLWEWQLFISPSIRLWAPLQQNWISIASVFSETDSVMRFSLHVQKTAARTQIYYFLFFSVQSETWKHY